MRDEDLAQLVGTTKNVIRYRRQLFDIEAWNVRMAIEPYRHLLGIESTRTVARLCGVSAYSVDQYRKSLGVKAKPGPPPLPKPKRFPVNHPLRRYKPLLGIVHDQDVADLAGVSRTTVRNWREALGRAPADPLPKQPTTAQLKKLCRSVAGLRIIVRRFHQSRYRIPKQGDCRAELGSPLAARGAPWTAEQSNTKGAALVNSLGSPRPQVRGVVKLPHTPRRRLGVTAHRQAEYACGGPAEAGPTFGGAPAIPLDRATF